MKVYHEENRNVYIRRVPGILSVEVCYRENDKWEWNDYPRRVFLEDVAHKVHDWAGKVSEDKPSLKDNNLSNNTKKQAKELSIVDVSEAVYDQTTGNARKQANHQTELAARNLRQEKRYVREE